MHITRANNYARHWLSERPSVGLRLLTLSWNGLVWGCLVALIREGDRERKGRHKLPRLSGSPFNPLELHDYLRSTLSFVGRQRNPETQTPTTVCNHAHICTGVAAQTDISFLLNSCCCCCCCCLHSKNHPHLSTQYSPSSAPNRRGHTHSDFSQGVFSGLPAGLTLPLSLHAVPSV